jgi:hypothetical protein
MVGETSTFVLTGEEAELPSNAYVKVEKPAPDVDTVSVWPSAPSEADRTVMKIGITCGTTLQDTVELVVGTVTAVKVTGLDVMPWPEDPSRAVTSKNPVCVAVELTSKWNTVPENSSTYPVVPAVDNCLYMSA